ncbi:MAG: hypothetical protein M3Y87_11235 [Myxococcota bacterium]|nr:hypothetical protein [Myxococcota bacterium]
MLDDRLTADERRALLYLLTSVALTDGRLTDSEVQFVQRLALPIAMEVGELLTSVDDMVIGDVCARLARPYAARIAILELLRLAHVDDVYARVEQRAIADLATLLGVDESTLSRMEDWVRREWELLAEARHLVDPSP